MPDPTEIHPLMFELGHCDDLRVVIEPFDQRIGDRLAETPREGGELRRGQRLIADENHEMVEQRLAQRRDGGIVQPGG